MSSNKPQYGRRGLTLAVTRCNHRDRRRAARSNEVLTLRATFANSAKLSAWAGTVVQEVSPLSNADIK